MKLYPFYLRGPNGNLLFTQFLPNTKAGHHAVIVFPPFAEELNRSRRMLAVQAGLLADAGIAVLLPDLAGTGDSDGDFESFGMRQWTMDLSYALEWLASQEFSEISIIAVRFGSLFLNRLGHALTRVKRVVLWNPVLSGKSYMHQFLRMKLASQLASRDVGSVAKVREAIASEGSQEIAGYQIRAEMLDEIDHATTDLPANAAPLNVVWMETGAIAEGPAPPQIASALEKWSTNHQVEFIRVKGKGFWIAPDIIEVEGLLSRTTAFLSNS